MDQPLAIRAQALTKRYGEVAVLDGLDLTVPMGSVFALLGPNGAGKTTAVRLLATLTRPDAGTASVAGFDVVRQRREVRRRISLTGQFAAVDDRQTGWENLHTTARLAGLGRRESRRKAEELLERLDLSEAGGRRVATYSGGMRRRLDLAAGLTVVPEVMFLDEPTTGLDPRSRREIWAVVAELAAQGTTVLLTTQYLEEADRLAGRIAVLDRGRLVAEGTPAQLKERVAEQLLELVCLDGAGFEDVVRRLGRRAVHADPQRLTVALATDGTALTVRRTLDDVDPARTALRTFAVRTASLDDVFLALTGQPPSSSAESESSTESNANLEVSGV